MAELKTQPNDQSVETFLNGVEDERKRQDCFAVLDLMKKLTGAEPRMWGTSIVGFGSYHYKYVSGREGDWFLTGFSPRKQSLTLYIMAGFRRYDALMSKLGKFKTGKSCLYIKRLEDVDREVLQDLIKESVSTCPAAIRKCPTKPFAVGLWCQHSYDTSLIQGQAPTGLSEHEVPVVPLFHWT